MGITHKKKYAELPPQLKDVNKINDYFISSSSTNHSIDHELLNFYNNTVKPEIAELFNFTLVNEDEILTTIQSITSTSCGIDNISITMIKLCCPHILPILTHIFNTCIERSIYPDAWKTSLIKPLPKTSTPNKLEDLRPISILPTISKIFEKLLHKQISSFLSKYNILPQLQSGFRSGHSCQTALLKVTDDIFSALDNSEFTVLILLDFSKAFDTVCHSTLLSVLHHIGFNINSITLIKSYLVERSQIVVIDNNYSTTVKLVCGVPQGSVLGPLLFSIYTSGIVQKIHYCQCHLYADDTQLYYSFLPENVKAANDAINFDLNKIIEFTEKHALVINPTKSKAILFGRPSQINLRNSIIAALNLKVKGIQLQFSQHVKNLGLIMDFNMKLGPYTKMHSSIFC